MLWDTNLCTNKCHINYTENAEMLRAIIINKQTSKVFLVITMNAQRGVRNVSPVILKPRTRQRWVVSLMPQLLYNWAKRSQYWLDRRVSGLHRMISCSCQDLKAPVIHPITKSLYQEKWQILQWCSAHLSRSRNWLQVSSWICISLQEEGTRVSSKLACKLKSIH